MDNRIYGNFCRLMKIFSMTFAAGLLGINVQAKTIQLTMQHMEQPPSRVEAMQVVVDKFNAKYPQYRMKQNVVGWGEAYSRVSAQVEAGVESTSSKLYRLFLLPLGRLVGCNLLQEFSTRLPKK